MVFHSNKTRTAIEGSDRFIGAEPGPELNKINPDTFAVEKIYTVSDGLSNDYILSLHESENKDLLIGTDGGGINVLKRTDLSALLHLKRKIAVI